MKIFGPFSIKFSALEASLASQDSNQLGLMAIEKHYHGELEAHSHGEMLSVMTTIPNAAGYVAIEQVVGVLNGRKGSFVLQHYGCMQNGKDYLQLEVVPGSGCGELEGLSGSISISRNATQHFYEMNFSLD